MRERGHIAGVTSNNYQYLIEKFIEKEGLKFDIILGLSDSFEKGKDHFELVMKKFSLSKKELIFVGDSLKDLEKALENEINFIGICGIFDRKDFLMIDKNIITINNLRELLTL